MSAQHVTLPAPRPNQAYLEVSALDGGRFSYPAWWILEGIPKTSTERIHAPSLAFFLRHSQSGKQVLYDLGLPKDLSVLPSQLPEYVIGKGKFVELPEDNSDVQDALKRGGADLADVDAIFISHVHWDHLGDHRSFIKAKFVLGDASETLVTGEEHPQHKSGIVPPKALPTERVEYVADWNTTIGGLKASDYFGDGSLYVIDTPGHLQGHIALLARTSADGSWILLAGDAAHHKCILHLEKDFAYHDDGKGDVFCMHVEPDVTRDTIKKLKVFADTPRVHVQIAHEDVDEEVYLPGKFLPKE
ncbi:Metallo-hydrolase oxidoreductase [Coniophora puteana RWD-64-598 SS2]|uniref:Metallo-hydrolase oxidoreductase n=1 Tax=Coniophora puteana (strain RWD-64-598) TaxID=741705 RepID=R7SDS8_CONPW|nr:Metallo-hydrolase oxidoreductase [Coniophora puteana RWD-64-598 SS2]EIW74030.1 Metallo-hydrolase oxidoreductase [Coniophora puteana RWD-64-598 SS2]